MEDAVRLYRQALELNPDAVERGAIYCNLGEALLGLYRRREALEFCEQAVALLPGNLEALGNLGNVLLEMGRIEEARRAYEAGLERNPQWLTAIHNLGTVLLEEGRFEEALEACERTLELAPDFADARLNRAILRLLRGEFAAGWADYEARLSASRTKRLRPGGEAPQWRGERLAGASILLYAEQGLGDAVQFLRYVPWVKQAGGQVVLVLPSKLMRLAAGLGVHLIRDGDAPPACSWCSSLMSLPLAYGLQTGDWTIPAWKPYLTVPADERARARSLARPADTLRIGLVWAGTPDHTRDWARSLSLDVLTPLLTLPGVQFYSLQVGPPALQAEQWQGKIIDLAPLDFDMADAAAKILELDLVIAVDTSVAHLAGALGKPVWLLLPWIPDWRWQLGREDSPWYPRMRLFRQPERHRWEPVIARVCEELRTLIDSGWKDRSGDAGVLDANDPESRAPQGDADSSRMLLDSAVQPDAEERLALPAALESPASRPCKICSRPSALFGVADFHKSCMEAQGKRLALAGVPVYYRRCEQCGFLATEFFDAWPDAAFSRYIYNADYLLVDPDAAEQRPAANARLVAEAFAAARASISILDYGGGSGKLAEHLQQVGFAAESYDPFYGDGQRPQKRFDLITAFEVMEHVPDPAGMVAAMASLLKTREQDGEDGLILFSTLLQPEDIQQTGVNWWYAAPRNGHCSLYTAAALTRLFASVGLQAASANAALHMAYRRPPAFAAHLRIGGAAHAAGA